MNKKLPNKSPNKIAKFSKTIKPFKVIAPAKVNLFLAVGDRNINSGKHDVLNILHTLVLHDVLFFEVANSEKFQINIDFLQSDDLDVEPPKIKTQDNLVYKAIDQLASAISFNNNIKISIYLEKNIPTGGGLGGGSSDAAAALIGAAKIFGIDPGDARLLKIARGLGADVPFFLQGGCSLYKGAGEIFDHKISPINREIIIVKPIETSLSTADVYAEFDKDIEDKLIQSPDLQKIEQATTEIKHADGLPMFNGLAFSAEQLMPQLTEIRQILSDACGDKNVLLCGSGACTFAFIPDDIHSDNVLDLVKKSGYWATLTSLANVRAKIVESID